MDGEFHLLSSIFICGSIQFEAWFRTKSSINQSADVFLVAFLVAAMHHGEDVHVEGSVSHKLFYSLDKIQKEYIIFHPDLKYIKITSDFLDNNPSILDNHNMGSATFFTAGVDSFYTLLKNEDEISKLVYVHGFDVWLYETEFRKLMDDHIGKVATELGKELILVETNIHEFCDRYKDWTFYHTSALASIAILLCNNFDKIYVASAYDHPDFRGWGISELDRLWSTEKVDIVPDGFEASRIQKVVKISHNPICQDHLKVCIDRTPGKYNCSKCEKCIRTIISLYVTEEMEKFKTFETQNINELVSNLQILNTNAYLFALENYNMLPDGKIKSFLKAAIDNYKQTLIV